MKKVILFALLVLASLQLGAQNKKGAMGRFYIAPRFGYNASLVTGLGDLDSKMRHGFNAGLGFEYMINPRLSLETGAYYSMQGARFAPNTSSEETSMKAELDYINVPLYVRGYAYQGLFFFAGPQFGFNTNAKVSGDGASGMEASGDFQDIEDQVKSFDVSLGLGMGYQDPRGLLISVNYNIGMSSVIDISGTQTGYFHYFDGAKNGVLQVNVGFRF